MKTKLIAANPGGIANRIKCIISMWRISDRCNTDFYVYWNRNDRCGAPFNKLFDNDFKLVDRQELLKMENKEVSQTWRLIPFPEEIPDKFSSNYNTKRGNNIDFEFDRIPINVRENILCYINRLKPIQVIESIVNNFTIKNDVYNLVGVHIRRGDFLDGEEGLGKVSSDNKFIEKMNEILKDDPSTKFLLCTDCNETEDKFKGLFEGKIIVYAKKNRDRTNNIATQQSLVDLLLLSKTKQIIGTYRSTFNELAWWLGGCKAKVDIIIDDDLNKQYEIKKEILKKSYKRRIKIFLYKLFCKLRLFK